jgi:F1F0 ATPase subunit 2
MTVPDAAVAGISLALGLFGGMAYVAGLRANVRAYLGDGPLLFAIAAHLLRLAVVAACFMAFAQAGIVGLLPALVGFVVGRSAMIRRIKGTT